MVEPVRGGAGLAGLLAAAVLDELDPVPVGVQRKRNVLLSAVAQLLLELHAALQELGLGRLDVVHREADVAKSTGLASVGLSHVVGLLGLGSVVVRKLQNTLSRVPRLALHVLQVDKRQHVESEPALLKGKSSNNLHSEIFSVKRNRHLRILDPNACVVHDE